MSVILSKPLSLGVRRKWDGFFFFLGIGHRNPTQDKGEKMILIKHDTLSLPRLTHTVSMAVFIGTTPDGRGDSKGKHLHLHPARMTESSSPQLPKIGRKCLKKNKNVSNIELTPFLTEQTTPLFLLVGEKRNFSYSATRRSATQPKKQKQTGT